MGSVTSGTGTAAAPPAWRAYLNPRYELILLLSAVFDACPLFAFFGMVLASLSGGQLVFSPLAYGALFLLALYGSRLLLALRISDRARRVATVGLALVSVLWLMRVTVYGQYAPFDFGWVGAALTAAVRLFVAFSPAGLIAIAGVVAWWRGVSLSQAPFDFESVGFRFRAGVLIVALLALINTFSARVEMTALLSVYFFCSLLAVALARQEDLGRSDAHISLPLRGPWLGILAGSALAVLALGALLGVALSPQGVALLAQVLGPLQPVLTLVLYALLVLVAILVEALVNAIAALLYRITGGTGGFEGFRLPQRSQLEVSEAPQDLNALAQLVDPTLTACAAILFLGVLALLAFGLNRMRRRSDPLGNETRESVPVSIGNPLQRLRRWLRVPRLEPRPDDTTSVRRIYASLVALAARRGFPRREAETPYEYIPGLRAAIRGLDEEERAITEAYVAVHYGERVPTPDDMRRVRAAWQRILAERKQTKGEREG